MRRSMLVGRTSEATRCTCLPHPRSSGARWPARCQNWRGSCADLAAVVFRRGGDCGGRCSADRGRGRHLAQYNFGERPATYDELANREPALYDDPAAAAELAAINPARGWPGATAPGRAFSGAGKAFNASYGQRAGRLGAGAVTAGSVAGRTSTRRDALRPATHRSDRLRQAGTGYSRGARVVDG